MSPDPEPLRLKRCDLRVCEGACCYDGVYLEADEEERLRSLVGAHPEAFPDLPPSFIVTGEWQGIAGGRKTAVRPHRYADPAHPAHFTHTRCVFALQDARCMLQARAEADGLHPWSYKPHACWMHPLRESAAGVIPPPIDPQDDPDRIGPEYPGYVSFASCGKHARDGDAWETVLAEELAWRATGPPESSPG